MMKRSILILIAIFLALLSGTASAKEVYAVTGDFQFALQDTWKYNITTSTRSNCVRTSSDGKNVAVFAVYDLKESVPKGDTEKMAELIKTKFGLTDINEWEKFQSADQTMALFKEKNDRHTIYYTAYNAGSRIAAIIYAVMDGYEIEGEFENAVNSITLRDSENQGYFRYGDAEVKLLSVTTKTLRKTKYLLLKFNWRNVGSDATMFAVNVGVTVFQDGVELKNAHVYDSEIATQLKSGKSIDVVESYELRSDTGELEIVVDKLIDVTHQYADRTYTYTLK